MYCPRCGNLNDDQANFCKACGTNLRAWASPPPATPYSQAAAPYPMAAPPSAAQVLPVQYAGFWRRFAAAIIDNIIVILAGIIVFFIAALCWGFFVGVSGGSEIDIENVSDDIYNLWFWSLVFITSFFYYTVMEASKRQATVGKLAMGIRVTDMIGGRIPFARAAGRFIAKILSNFLLIGFIMIAFTEKKQGLHDQMAGTLVMSR